MSNKTAAKPTKGEAISQGILEAILLLQEGQEIRASLPGAISALSKALLLDTASLYQVKEVKGNTSVSFEFSLLYSAPEQEASTSLLSSDSLDAPTLEQLCQDVYLIAYSSQMPGQWRRFVPESPGQICRLCPMLLEGRLIGLLAVSGEEGPLSQEMPLRVFCQSLRQLLFIDTLQKRTKEQVSEAMKSRKMLNMAVEGAKLGIWEWDIEKRLVTYSNRFLQHLGYDPNKFSNQYTEFEKLFHPDDIPRLIEEFKAQTLQDESFELDYRLLANCGRYHWVYDKGLVVQRNQEGVATKAVGISIDITQRKEAEIALEKSEAVQKATLKALPDLKFRLNMDGVFLDYFSSPDSDKPLFLPPEKFLGRSVEEVMPEYLAKAVMKNLQLTFELGKVQSFEYPLSVHNAIHYFEARVSAIDDNEVIAVVRNITALKQARQELEHKVRELDKNNQKLQKYVDSNLELENFAHTVSHDLREPVRTINSFSQLLQKKYQGQLDKEADSYLNFITSSASNMNTLIEDLLEYSRFENNQHHTEEIPLEQLLQAVKNALSEQITEHGASVNICTSMPKIQGNWTKISQLFQNLISNAIKFRREEEKPVVDIYAFEEKENWKFAVKDKGIGIHPEFQQQIFLLFRRLHSKRYYPGSGIGLALCKRVVEQHGGKIWIESQVDKGSTFYFTIPK